MILIDFIKKTCKENGVDEKHAARIQKTFKIEKEEDVVDAVDAFVENILPAITEAETKAQKDAEEAAKKTAIETYEKDHGLKDGKPIESEHEEKEKPTGLDSAIKELIDNQSTQLKEMRDLLTKSQQKAEDAEKVASVKVMLKNSSLPEKWIDRVKLDSNISFEDQVKDLAEEHTEIQQNAMNEKVARGEFIPGGFKVPDRSEADWLKIMNGDTSDSASGVAPLE